jgi:hypothetical protein
MTLKMRRQAVRAHSTWSTDAPKEAINLGRATLATVASRTDMKVAIITVQSTIER